ncbi:MAG TPA: hypothetical protein VF277_02500 [Steroidobacteraceae bacterium]
MLDASQHPEVTELIRAHEHSSAGDCTSQWGTVLGNDEVVHLHLEFIRPVATAFQIEFELPKMALAVDNILRARGVYLLEGPEDSTFTSTEDEPRILAELPPTGFEKIWERIYRRTMTSMFREQGLPRQQARRNAEKSIMKMRDETNFDFW